MATNENPLNLPPGANRRPHQLRLQRLTDQDAGRRVALCTLVLNDITTRNSTALFNALERAHQIAALLIEEEDGNHNRLDAFRRATLGFQQRALYRSDHKDENVAVMYQKLGWDT